MTAPAWDFPRLAAGVRKFVEVAAEHGLDASQSLAGTGLVTLDGEHLVVTAGQEVQVARNIVHHLGDVPGLGLEAGLRSVMSEAGPLGFAALSSPTLGSALRTVIEFIGLTQAFVHPVLQTTTGRAVLQLQEDRVPADVRSMLVERDLAGILPVVFQLVGGSLPSDVQLSFALDEDRLQLLNEALSDTPHHVRPGATNRVVVPLALLDRPLPTADAARHRALMAQSRELLRMVRQGPRTSTLVADRLARPGPEPSMEEVATALSTSTRTLRRRLADEGTSFTEVRTHRRIAVVRELLTTTTLDLQAIAERSGYHDAASVVHAFVRVEGTTPHAYRVRERTS